MKEKDIEDQSILIQEDLKKGELVIYIFLIVHLFHLELFIDNNYENLMKFSDLLYNVELPNNEIPVAVLAKEKKQQKTSTSKK